jgi:hypothetical protein
MEMNVADNLQERIEEIPATRQRMRPGPFPLIAPASLPSRILPLFRQGYGLAYHDGKRPVSDQCWVRLW